MARAGGPDRGLFDLWSLFYDWPLVQRLTYRPGQDAVLRVLAEVGARRVLDVGCGTGLLTARIAAAGSVTRSVGCDFSRGMLRRAADRSDAPAWVCADAGRLPLRGGAFDAVTCTEAFHWFPDPIAALSEFHRVLGPGGHILLALVNPPLRWQSRLAASVSRLAGEPLHWPTRGELRRAVEAAGFRVESQRRVLRIPLAFPAVLTVARRA